MIAAGLDADTAYWWFVTDQFGNVWRQQATTDVNGVLTIYQSYFPDGFLSAGTGSLTIELKDNETDLENVQLLIDGAAYSCLTLFFSPDQPLSALFGLQADYCIDSADVLLVAPSAGGIFSGDGVSLFVDGNYYFSPSSVTVGVHVVTWTSGTQAQHSAITVHALPIVTLDDFGAVTLSSPPFNLYGGLPTGGIYFANDIEVTGLFDPADYGKTDVTIRYEYHDSYGCSSSAEAILSIGDDVEAVGGCMTVGNPNYNPLATFDDGSCFVSQDALVTFETDELKPIETQVGANILESDIQKLPQLQSAAVALQLQLYYWFTLHTEVPDIMDESLATIINNFVTACNADIAVYYPVAKISTPPFTVLDWLIARFDPVFVALDQESQVSDATTYKARAAAAIAHLGNRQTVYDTALVYRTSFISMNWNVQLSSESGTDSGRQYIQIKDNVAFTTDMDQNLVRLNDYFNNLLPGWLDDFLTRLPNLTKEVIAQWQTEDSSQNFLSDKPLGNWTIGKTVQFILSNTEHFSYILWMTIGTMIKRGVPQGEYYSIKRKVPLFKFPYVFPVTIPFPGCDALGFWNGADDWAFHVLNQLGDEHNLTADQIGIPGKTISGNFTNDYGTALSWNDPQVNNVEVTSSINIHRYGDNVIYFSTAPGSSLTPATHTVLPNVTDPLITLATDAEHYAYVPGLPNGKLMIFLPGSGARPSGTQLWMQTAQDEGYHVLGVHYYNKLPSTALCNTVPNPTNTYLDLYCQEILFGGDLSPLTDVSVSNSVENRIKKLLQYLITNYLAEGWDTFLVGGVIQWNLITVSGHSQGGDHAAFLGKYRALDKVIMFSSPRDLCHFGTATVWDSPSFLTDISKYRAFSHNLDSYDKQLPTWTDMGIELPPVDVEIDPVEANWGKTLITSRTTGIANFHKSTLIDAVTPLTGGVPDFLPVWVHLLNT